MKLVRNCNAVQRWLREDFIPLDLVPTSEKMVGDFEVELDFSMDLELPLFPVITSRMLVSHVLFRVYSLI
jgi:hypothetical protein